MIDVGSVRCYPPIEIGGFKMIDVSRRFLVVPLSILMKIPFYNFIFNFESVR
jgi:hypothetical protein